jgi:hypothetical protein
MLNHQDLLAQYDQHLRIEIEHPGVRKEAFPQLVRFIKPAPGMNYIAYSHLDEANIDAVIQDQIAYFASMPQPFSWHVYEHDVPLTLKDRLLAHGFAPDDDPDAVMVLDVQEAPPALLESSSLEIRRLTQPDQLDDVVRVEEQVLGGDFSWLKRRLSPHLEIPDYLSVYVAYVDGQPACSGWIYFYPHNPFAGLFGGATLPSLRKRGLYSAVLAVRVQEALQRNYRFVTTGASPMSQPILAHHGFQLLTYAYAHERKGNTDY